MNTERLTTKSRDVITGAVADAGRRGHATVEPWHLLLSLLDTGGSTASALLRAQRPTGRRPNFGVIYRSSGGGSGSCFRSLS